MPSRPSPRTPQPQTRSFSVYITRTTEYRIKDVADEDEAIDAVLNGNGEEVDTITNSTRAEES